MFFNRKVSTSVSLEMVAVGGELCLLLCSILMECHQA